MCDCIIIPSKSYCSSASMRSNSLTLRPFHSLRYDRTSRKIHSRDKEKQVWLSLMLRLLNSSITHAKEKMNVHQTKRYQRDGKMMRLMLSCCCIILVIYCVHRIGAQSFSYRHNIHAIDWQQPLHLSSILCKALLDFTFSLSVALHTKQFCTMNIAFLFDICVYFVCTRCIPQMATHSWQRTFVRSFFLI